MCQFSLLLRGQIYKTLYYKPDQAIVPDSVSSDQEVSLTDKEVQPAPPTGSGSWFIMISDTENKYVNPILFSHCQLLSDK